MSSGLQNTGSGTPPAATEAPKPRGAVRVATDRAHFVQYTGKRKYAGEDPGDKKLEMPARFFSIAPGEVVEVSPMKAQQLLRDFPREFKASNLDEFRKWEDKRAQDAQRASVKAEAEYKASVEREQRARQKQALARASSNIDDDEDDGRDDDA